MLRAHTLGTENHIFCFVRLSDNVSSSSRFVALDIGFSEPTLYDCISESPSVLTDIFLINMV